MKRLLALFLAVILVFSLFGCARPSDDETASNADTTETADSTDGAETDDSADTGDADTTDDNSGDSVEEIPASGNVDAFNGPTDPVKVPEGKKIAFVSAQASLSGCIVPIEAMTSICDEFGWEYQIFDGEGVANVQNTCIMNAVTWGADAIVCVSILAATVQSGLQAATEAGIPIVSASNGTDSPNPRLDLEYDFAYDIGPDYVGLGAAMADWVKENTEGSGKVVVYSCPGSYSVDYFEEGLLARFDELGVEYSDGNVFTFEQMGDELNRTIIGYLTNNPDTEFVFLPFDPAAVSVIDGLSTAGFTDVKVLGVLGNTEMCSLISQGTIAAATAAYDNVYMGYACMDQLLRIFNDVPLFEPHGENLPFAIVDETNVPAEGEAWTPDFDYVSSYYALWEQE